jgi:hypothetical protein
LAESGALTSKELVTDGLHAYRGGLKARGLATSDNTTSIGDAGEIGWLRAHVRVGDSYPTIAVRVCRRAADGAVLVVLDREHEAVLNAAAYAVAVARNLHEAAGGDVSAVRIDASLFESGAPEVRLDLRVAGRGLDADRVGQIARSLLRDGALGAATISRVELDGEAAASGLAAVVGFGPTWTVARRTAVARVVFTAGAVLAVAVAWTVLPRNAGLPAPPAEPSVTDDREVVALESLADASATPSSISATPVLVVPPTAIAELPTATAELRTARPTAAPTLTALPPTATAVVLPQAAPFDFAPDRASGLTWPDNPRGSAFFAPDGYHLASRTPGRFVAVGLLPNQQGAVITATFRKIGGPAGGGYGIIVGDEGPGPRDGVNQQGKYLVFEVGDKGETGIWRRDGDQWADIVGWTPSPAVRAGTGDNTLELRLAPGQVVFSVNGTAIVTHTSAVAGGIGVFLGGDGNEAVLTRLSVTALI